MSEDEKAGMSPLREAAVQLHEMYTELKAAGFTRGEAIELVAKTLASGFENNQANDDD